jgi:alcohol dehydrogenase class IV
MASSSSTATTPPTYPSTLLGTYTPTPLLKIHYGPSSLPTHLIPSIRFLLAKRQGCKEEDVKAKVMIVTGRSLKEKTPVVKDVERLLRREGMYGLTFSDIAQHARMSPASPYHHQLHPPCLPFKLNLTSSLFPRTAIKDIQIAKQLALDNEIDLLLSIGGGSPIDSTKAISHFVKEATGSEGSLPHIAVPTTLSVAETTQ